MRWLALPLSLAACKHSDDPTDGPDGSFVLEGTVPAARRDVSAPITRVVAVPHERGDPRLGPDTLLTDAPLDADGHFSLSLSPTLDWVLLLVDDAAPPPERIRGYVTLGAGREALACVPLELAAVDAVDLGTLTDAGDEAVGEVPAGTFTIDDTTLVTLASSDEACKNLGNAWLNLDLAAGRSWLAEPSFRVTQPMTAFDTDRAGPPMSLDGWFVGLTGADDRVDVDGICSGARRVELVPPTTVRVSDAPGLPPREYGPTAPFTSEGELFSQPAGCVTGDLNVSADGDRLGINLPMRGLLLDVVPGVWTLRVDGEELAWFDLGVTSPIVDGVHTGPAPIVSSVAQPDGTLDGLHVDWVAWDGAAYAPADPDALEGLVYESFLSLLAMEGDVQHLSGTWVEGGGYADAVVPGQHVMRDLDLTDRSPRWLDFAHRGDAGGAPVLLEVDLGLVLAGVTTHSAWTGGVCRADEDADAWFDCMDCDDTDPAVNTGPCP